MSINPYEPPQAASPAASGSGRSKVRMVPRAEVPRPAPGGTVVASQDRSNNPPTWEIAFGRDELWLVPPGDGDVFVLTHLELAEYADIVQLGSLAAIVVRELPKRTSLWLPNDPAVESFRAWLGQKRSLHVSKALKKRLRFSLPVGIFVALTAAPVLVDQWDPFALVFGVGLVGLAIVSPYRPRPALFAITGVLWISLAASNAVGLVRGSTGVGWTVFWTALQLMLAFGSFKAYRFYAGIPDRETPTAP